MTTATPRITQAALPAPAKEKANHTSLALPPLLKPTAHHRGLDSSRLQPVLAEKSSISLVEVVIVAHWIFFIALIVACCLL